MPLRQKVLFHALNPFREERKRSVDHTRRISHVSLHCSSSSSRRSVKHGIDDGVGHGQKQVTEEGLNNEEIYEDEGVDYDYYDDPEE